MYSTLIEYEAEISRSLNRGDLSSASNAWHEKFRYMKSKWSLNLYDMSRSQVDLTEKNFWHFLQQSHVRKAIHVGSIVFDNGENVSVMFCIYTTQ